MKEYQEYSRHLGSLVEAASCEHLDTELVASIEQALDGQPASELHKLVSINDIREAGAFFTGSMLAQSALKGFLNTIDSESIIYDPACGVGDLLLVCASKLMVYNDIVKNIDFLEKRLLGRDLFDEFIYAAKSRLILSAISSAPGHGLGQSIQVEQRFSGITKGCGLEDISPYRKATHVVINPPFIPMQVPEGYRWWGRGKVNSAAVFLANCVDNCRPNTRILAILPDVLRSGPMYQKWRKYISSKAIVLNVNLHGQFGRSAEIDVFSVELLSGNDSSHCPNIWGYPDDSHEKTLEDYFEIRIGPVVDFRHPHQGENYPFVQVNGLSLWNEEKEIYNKRRFTGQVFNPPFVVVRRNSRKNDKFRAIGTIINIKEPVAVENHLIVLKPKDGTIETCKNLLKNLKNQKSKEWFDKRVCCRHLTISALKNLPWWGDAPKVNKAFEGENNG